MDILGHKYYKGSILHHFFNILLEPAAHFWKHVHNPLECVISSLVTKLSPSSNKKKNFQMIDLQAIISYSIIVLHLNQISYALMIRSFHPL